MKKKKKRSKGITSNETGLRSKALAKKLLGDEYHSKMIESIANSS